MRQDVFKSPRYEFDPLDREILERAFYAAWSTVKETDRSLAFGGDESLAATLRNKLLEIAQTNSFNDAEDLRDILLDRLTPDKP